MVKEGKYEATASDYGAGESSTGKPFVYVYFNVDGGSVKWTGYLSPAAIEKTMEQLTYVGCKDFVSIADGITGGALDPNVKVQITVEHEKDEKTGKVFAKARWINRIGGPKKMDAAQITQAKTTLAAYQGQFLAAQQKSGASTSKKVSVGF